MLSNEQQNIVDAFSEVAEVGKKIADNINLWNEANLDEDFEIEEIKPEMSGEYVLSVYKENCVQEEVVAKVIYESGFEIENDDSDEIEEDTIKISSVDERMNMFLEEVLDISAEYKKFSINIQLAPCNSGRDEEVLILIKSTDDFRKLPFSDERKTLFMEYLKKVREKEEMFGMTDETIFFNRKKKEMNIIVRRIAVHRG